MADRWTSVPGRSVDTQELSGDHRHLEALIEIVGTGECPITEVGTAASSIRKSSDTGRCVVEFVTDNVEETCRTIREVGGECCRESGERRKTDGQQIVQASYDTGAICACRVFEKHGCLPRIERFVAEENRLVIKTYLEGRDTLHPLVEDLRSIADRVEVCRLRRATATSDGTTDSIPIDVSGLSEKQRECLRVALEESYFDDPRGITLEELADRLDVSPSAASRRLRSIQSRLLGQLELELDERT